ncbi:hypothetical protein PIB30_082072 [Stylosanthes scabra]|uniref:Uncharacterized protein n=1 Tax=Stylosanthes scabra TaxID=79078 RepID=A0ABU6TRF5_9FABA|nr:hypothetical protein [Stylosanthes scabra]
MPISMSIRWPSANHGSGIIVVADGLRLWRPRIVAHRLRPTREPETSSSPICPPAFKAGSARRKRSSTTDLLRLLQSTRKTEKDRAFPSRNHTVAIAVAVNSSDPIRFHQFLPSPILPSLISAHPPPTSAIVDLLQQLGSLEAPFLFLFLFCMTGHFFHRRRTQRK